MVLVAKGGKGGRGNSKNSEIKKMEYGHEGEKKNLVLELKLLAEIGLVGYPNAGKSTLVASLTRALPKIAGYPFTTLSPTIGKIKFIDNF